jgi:hypothetical protein
MAVTFPQTPCAPQSPHAGRFHKHAASACHLDRARRSMRRGPQQPGFGLLGWSTEGEWRDPEDASSAMPIRGVLPKPRVRRQNLAENCGREIVVSGRALPSQHAKAVLGAPGWVELPESAWSRKHPRDRSTRPLSLRSIVLAQDGRLRRRGRIRGHREQGSVSCSTKREKISFLP